MESLLESVFSKYLKEYILNYRKENFSMQFLRGEGGLRDFDIDCNTINAMLGANLPALTFTRIYVTKLSVRAQYTKLKTKPIELLIDEIYVEVTEPVRVETDPAPDAPSPQQSPKQSKYGFVERIVDSITVHINKLHLHIRTLGKMKCEPIGPWTPPVIEIILEHVKYCSTDPNGDALSLEDCFERSPAPEGQIVIHKRLHAQVAHAYMINPNRYAEVLKEQKLQNYFTCRAQSAETAASASSDPNRTYRRVKLFTTSLHIAFAFRKRLSDCTLLALELEFLVPDIIVTLKPWVAQELMHCVLGICYALWREQAIRRIYGPFPHGEPNSPTVAASLGTPRSPPPAGPRARVVLATRLQNVDITLYSDTTENSKPSGVRLVVIEFLHELLMTEDMAFTESVAQLLIQKIFVNEVYGRRNMCIAQGIRDDGLMSAATPILLDRGVIPFETKCYDIDQQAFVMKMVTNWPPPPLPAVGSRIEASLTPIAIHLEPYPIIKAIESFNSVWDPRHITGQWTLPAGTDHLIERQIGIGTSEMLLRVAGVQMTLPPPTGVNPVTSCPWSSSIPQLTLSCSQISVFVSSSLNVTIPQSAVTAPSSSGAGELVSPQLVGKLVDQTYDGCSLLPYRLQVAVECVELSMSRTDGKPDGYPLLSVAAVTFGSFSELHPDVLHNHRQANVPHDAYSRMFYVPSGRSGVAVTTLYAQGAQLRVAPAKALWAFENIDAYRVILASRPKQTDSGRVSEPAQTDQQQQSSRIFHVQVADCTVELLDDMDELGYRHPNADGLTPVMSIHSEKLEFLQEQDLHSASSAHVTNISTNAVLVSSSQRPILLLTTGRSGGPAGTDIVLNAPPQSEVADLHWLARLGQGACSPADVHSTRPSLFISLGTTCDDEEFLHRYLVHAAPNCVVALHPEALSEVVKVLTRIAAYDVSTALGTVLQSRPFVQHVKVISRSVATPQAATHDATQTVNPAAVHARQFKVAVKDAHLFVFSAFGGAYRFDCRDISTTGDKFPDADPELDGMGFGKIELASKLRLAYARSLAEQQPLFETLTDAVEVRMSAKRAAVDPDTPLSPISAAQPYHWSINWSIPDAVLNFSNVHRRALFDIVELIRTAVADLAKTMAGGGDSSTIDRKGLRVQPNQSLEQSTLFHGAEDVSGLVSQIHTALDDVLSQCRTTQDLLRATSATALTSLQKDAIAVEHLAELVRMTRNEVAVLRATVDANHCGWLRRSDGSLSARVKRRSARRYWAVLKGQTLYLLANPGSKEILEAVDLHSRYACDVEVQHTEFVLVDRLGKKTRFIADDIESKLGWLDALPKGKVAPRSPAIDGDEVDARSVVEEAAAGGDAAADDSHSSAKMSRQKRLSLRKTVHAVNTFKNTLTKHLHIRTQSTTLSITTGPSPREDPPATEQNAQPQPTRKPSLRIDTNDRQLLAAALRDKFSSDEDSEPSSPRRHIEDGQHTTSSQPASGETAPPQGLNRLVRTASSRSKAPSHTDDSVSDHASTCLDIDEVTSYFHSEIDRTMHLSASVTSQVAEHRAQLETNHYDMERDIAVFESKLKNVHVLMHALRFKLVNACKEFAQREASQQAMINELRRLLHEEQLRVAELEKQLARSARQRDAAELDLKQYAQRQMRRIQKLEDENDALKMVLSDEHWKTLAERHRPPPSTTPVSATSMSQLQELVKQLTSTLAEQKQAQRELHENVEMATEETRMHKHLAQAAGAATRTMAEEQATSEKYMRDQIAQLQQSLQAEVLRRQAAELITEDLRASLDAMVALAGNQLRPSS